MEPIRLLDDIARIKSLLKDKPRDSCIFSLGVNSAYRAGELLSLAVGQVAHLQSGDQLEIRQSKNGKHRAITLNRTVAKSIAEWLAVHPNPDSGAPLFISKKGNKALTVPALNRMIKSWCREVGISGNFGTHSMRKTWAYHVRLAGYPLPVIMTALAHTNQAQTLAYICVQEDEISQLYDLEL